MKTLLVAATAALFTLIAPSPASAGIEISLGFGQTYQSGRASCGCPIYTRRICRGYDHARRPIFAYHRLPFHCGCKHKKHPPGKAKGHSKNPYHPHGIYGKHHGKHPKHGKKCK